MPAGRQDAVELRQDDGEFRRRDVDDGPAREHAVQRAVGDVEGGHRAHVEPQVRVGPAGQRDHRGRGVDAERRQSQAVQVGGDVAGPAAQVRDPALPVRAYGLGEDAEHRAVQGLSRSESRNISS